MPQLDPSYFASQFFWLIISFALLYLVIYFKAVPNLKKIITEREKSIDGNIKEAEKLRLQAEQIEAEYNVILRDAKTEAAQLINDTAANIKKELEQKTAQLDKEIALKLQETEAKVAKMRLEASQDLEAIITPIATAIISKITANEPDDNLLKNSVNQLIEGNKLN